jgi:hypothetical protein
MDPDHMPWKLPEPLSVITNVSVPDWPREFVQVPAHDPLRLPKGEVDVGGRELVVGGGVVEVVVVVVLGVSELLEGAGVVVRVCEVVGGFWVVVVGDWIEVVGTCVVTA